PHAGPLKTVVFSPDGTRALTGAIALKNSKKPGQIPDFGGEARLWNVATGSPLTPSLKQRKPVWAVAFSKDGRTLLTGNQAGWLPPARRFFPTSTDSAMSTQSYSVRTGTRP